MNISRLADFQRDRLMEYLFRPVEKRQILGSEYGIFDIEQNKLVSKVSERYTLITNDRLIKPFIKHFGLERLVDVNTYGAGRKYVFTFETGREMEFNGSKVKERLVIGNSIDRTQAYSFMLGAFVFVCCNGLFTGTAVITYRKKHVGVIPVEEQVSQVLNSYESNSFDVWQKFADTPLDMERREQLTASFYAFNEPEEDAHINDRGGYYEPKDNVYYNRVIREQTHRLIHNNQNRLDNQANAWGLLNQMNRVIASKRILGTEANTHRRMLANINAESYLAEQLHIEPSNAQAPMSNEVSTLL